MDNELTRADKAKLVACLVHASQHASLITDVEFFKLVHKLDLEFDLEHLLEWQDDRDQALADACTKQAVWNEREQYGNLN